MKKFFVAFIALSQFYGAMAYAADPRGTISTLEARLMKIGEPKVDGSEKAGATVAPVMFFGTRKINNNYDVVDEIKKSTGATATIFVVNGDEFTRVSTNVLTPEGKRGVGTNLARAKAYDALKKGEIYCGDVDVLGTAFNACYAPIKDKAGKILGATYIGFKK